MSTLQQEMGLHCQLPNKRKFEEDYTREASREWTKKAFYESEPEGNIKFWDSYLPGNQWLLDSGMGHHNVRGSVHKPCTLGPSQISWNDKCYDKNHCTVETLGRTEVCAPSKADTMTFNNPEKYFSKCDGFSYSTNYTSYDSRDFSDLKQMHNSVNDIAMWNTYYEPNSFVEYSDQRKSQSENPPRSVTPAYFNGYGGSNHFVEEGKSYLEIGGCDSLSQCSGNRDTAPSPPPVSPKQHTFFSNKFNSRLQYGRLSGFYNCDRTSGRIGCPSNQRLVVLNISMYKLSRYKQFAEPSLHKSVLICNTLRLLEKGLEDETTCFKNSQENANSVRGQADVRSSEASSVEHIHTDRGGSVDSSQANVFSGSQVPEPHSNALTNGRQYTELTPLDPVLYSDLDKVIEDDEIRGTTINWCRVLSLASQSDLDSVNNNVYIESQNTNTQCTSASADDTFQDLDLGGNLDTWKLTPLVPLKPEDMRMLHMTEAMS